MDFEQSKACLFLLDAYVAKHTQFSCIFPSHCIELMQFYLGSPEKILPGLVQWTSPQHSEHPYGVGNFRVFLPPTDDWTIGQPYYVIEPLEETVTGVHMNRYHPSTPIGSDVLIFSLLSQFHPNVFVHTRFGPHGTIATVRAQNEKYLDIVIRY